MPVGNWLLPRIGFFTSGRKDDALSMRFIARGNLDLWNGTENIGINQIQADVRHKGHLKSFSIHNPNGWNTEFNLYQILWNKGRCILFPLLLIFIAYLLDGVKVSINDVIFGNYSIDSNISGNSIREVCMLSVRVI